MAGRVEWYDDEHTILYFVIQGSWTWRSAVGLLDEGYALMENAAAEKVQHVIDLSGAPLFPENFLTGVRHMSQRPRHPKSGHIIIVGANALIRSLWQAFLLASPESANKVQLVKTLAEADALLAQEDDI